MSETKLEPCPFCGTRLTEVRYYWRHPTSMCINSGMAITETWIAAWNRRAAHADRDGVIEEIAIAADEWATNAERDDLKPITCRVIASRIRSLKSTTEDSHG